jgi:hypothetical protein
MEIGTHKEELAVADTTTIPGLGSTTKFEGPAATGMTLKAL